jgi:hypothetical protein
METIESPMLEVPVAIERTLEPSWLEAALAPISGGAAVVWVGDVIKLETFAAKVRFGVRFAGDERTHRFCLKGFLNPDIAQKAGITAVREALFYQRLAPQLSMRLPGTITVIDQQSTRAILIMEDLVVAGARFCSALDPFTVEMAAQSLDQIARLHAARSLLKDNDWLPSRLAFLATGPHFTAPQLQKIMDGPRSRHLSSRTANATLLLDGMKALALRFADRLPTILHGDCHAGNFYLTTDGPGVTDWQLVQRGCWAQDVAYHIAAVLPEDVAVREERALLDHYLDRVKAHGGVTPADEVAWQDYRIAQIYGFYHWAITVRVEPEIIDVFMQRLGAGMERHDTYALLGM